MTSRGLIFALLASAACVACERHPPDRLLPHSAVILAELPRRSETCYAHRTWKLRTSLAETERWAIANDLPCADTRTPCTRWSTSKRSSPFWKSGRGEPNGLDSVDASWSSGELTVDWGDYTCSGPN